MAVSDKNWQEWSRKVLEELVKLNSENQQLKEEIGEKYDNLRDDMLDRFQALDRKIDKQQEILTGNGSPEKGLLIRVDRLEQTDNKRSWLLRTTIGTSIGSIIAALIALMMKLS